MPDYQLIERVRVARIARDAQIAALPPQPERLDTNLLGFNRRPFVHARVPRSYSYTLGDLPTETRRLEENPALQAEIAQQFPDLSIEDLLIARELPADVAGAIRQYWASYDPAAPTTEALALYKPSGVSRTLTCIMPTNVQTDTGRLYQFMGPMLSAPARIQQINWTAFAGADMLRMRLIVDGYGIVAECGQFLDKSDGNIGAGGGMNFWVLNGSIQPRIEFDTAGGGSLLAGTASITVVAEPLIRI